ncbi:MAG: SDR family oxidoreductase [Actinomycetota bacterium]|nr:SDR family oxidoreductase [Actinomycetota bacterium]
MDLGLRGRAAAVSASSKGLGRAVALELAREGVDVAICARSEAALRDTESALRETDVRVLAMPIDLTEAGAPAAFVEATVAEFGRLDILFANVGGPPAGTVDTFELADYEEAVNSNLMAQVKMCLAALPHMRAARWGRIIILGSLTMKQPVEGLMLSTMARSGVAGFAKSLSDEIAAEGITVNCVCPGRILTDRIRTLAQMRSDRTGEPLEVSLKLFDADMPAKRMGQPEELSALVAFLASERASYITGAAIQVDGGWTRSIT